MLVALGAGAVATGLWAFGGSAAPAARDRLWVALPGEMPMPAAPPDDPGAYRGARFRAVDNALKPSVVESEGREVPWLKVSGGNVDACGGSQCTTRPEHPYFGSAWVLDGRRQMVWFIRTVEPGVSCCPSRTQYVEPVAGPLVAVLDVLVLPDVKSKGGGRWERGCGPDEVIIVGDKAWRLNGTTGRIEPVDPDDAVCPDYD